LPNAVTLLRGQSSWKFQPTSKRLGDDELKAMFAEMWPRCLGALFTGMAGALRNWRSIKISEPARLAGL